MKRMKYMNRRSEGRGGGDDGDDDPMSGVANLFDVAMVFAVGLLLMIVIYFSMPELLTQQDVTVVKISEQSVEIIEKHGEIIEKLEMSNKTVETEIAGKFGTIYKTKDGGYLLETAKKTGS
ncbi:MAG: DUF2149 domain-containing protein [Euryarchaeota archaeon]|nr:DUF2149 domain-containing protein [Euryarchaeota archaeon]